MIDIEKREAAWDAYSQQPIEFTVSLAFNAGYNAALSENAWVAVEDRLPEDGQDVLVQRESGWIERDKFVDGLSTIAFSKPIVAWMPLPKPFQEKKNAK